MDSDRMTLYPHDPRHILLSQPHTRTAPDRRTSLSRALRGPENQWRECYINHRFEKGDFLLPSRNRLSWYRRSVVGDGRIRFDIG